MKKIHAFKKSSDVSEIRQFLQTFYQEFFQNRKISRKTHQKRSSFFVIKELSDDIRRTKETSHRNICVFVFFIRIRNILEIRFVRLRVSKDFILKRE
jgi:hypothetical protein